MQDAASTRSCRRTKHICLISLRCTVVQDVARRYPVVAQRCALFHSDVRQKKLLCSWHIPKNGVCTTRESPLFMAHPKNGALIRIEAPRAKRSEHHSRQAPQANRPERQAQDQLFRYVFVRSSYKGPGFSHEAAH